MRNAGNLFTFTIFENGGNEVHSVRMHKIRGEFVCDTEKNVKTVELTLRQKKETVLPASRTPRKKLNSGSDNG